MADLSNEQIEDRVRTVAVMAAILEAGDRSCWASSGQCDRPNTGYYAQRAQALFEASERAALGQPT